MAPPVEPAPGVYLVGAGLSMASPANVMSWWDLNNGVLEELKERTLAAVRMGPDEQQIVKSLSLDQLSIVGFSQAVADVSAGEQKWFELLRLLDGDAPNRGHLSLASMVSSGMITCVVSTNFDTLIERGLEEYGVDFDLRIPGRDRPPSMLSVQSKPLLVKLHGSVDDDSSMIDLARQKARGFSNEWKTWLGRTFETNPLTVVGFSGRDLEVSEDYLSLFSAAERIPSLTWLSQTGLPEVEVVDRLIRACGPRARLVRGSLPEFLLAQSPVPPSLVSRRLNRSGAIKDWFYGPLRHPLSCAVTICRLLREAGRADDARSLRAATRAEIGRFSVDRSALDTMWIYNVLVALGHESLPEDPLIAHEDFLRAIELEVEILETDMKLDVSAEEHESIRQSHALGVSQVMSGFALCAIHFGHWGRARDLVVQMQGLIPSIGLNVFAHDRNNFAFEAIGSLAAESNDIRTAACAFRISSDGYRRTGDVERSLRCRHSWALAVGYMGESRLAVHISSDYEISEEEQEPADANELLSVAKSEWSHANGRFDEVLWSILLSLDEDSRPTDSVIESLRALAASEPGDVASALLIHAAVDYLGGGRLETLALPGSHSMSRDTVVPPTLMKALKDLGDDLMARGTNPEDSSTEAVEAAIGTLSIAHYAYVLAEQHTESIRARLFVADALAPTKPDAARAILDATLARTPTELTPLALETHVRLLVGRAIATGQAAIVTAEAEIRRIREEDRLGSGSEAAFVALSHLGVLQRLGRLEEALVVADEAVVLAAGSRYSKDFESYRESIRAATEPAGGEDTRAE